MLEIRGARVAMVTSSIVLFSLFAGTSLLSPTARADDMSHYSVARQLVDLTYNEQSTYVIAQQFAVVAVKDRFENNPKTKEYSAVLTGAVMEILDAYFHDPETQNKIKTAFAKTFAAEFAENELSEMVTFYRTPTGQKALQRFPIVMQKGWEQGAQIGSQISSSPKYQHMLVEKIKALQDQGALPRNFK